MWQKPLAIKAAIGTGCREGKSGGREADRTRLLGVCRKAQLSGSMRHHIRQACDRQRVQGAAERYREYPVNSRECI